MMKKNEEKKGKKETGKKVMSVKAKLLMILIPCIALAMALLILVFYMLVAKQMKRTSEDMLESSVRSQENQIESWMNEKLAAFQMIKTDIEKEPRTDEELQKLLDLYVGYESDYPDGIYLADSKGNLMTGEDSGKTDKNPLESVWYKQGLTRINMAFGSCYENSDGTNVISASGILNDGSDNIRVLSADVSLDRVSIIVNSNVDMSGAVSFLVDLTDNTILAHRDSKIVSTSLSGQSVLNLDLPNDVAEYIANHLKQNIRQLEGAVKKLNAYYMLEGIAPCIGVTTTAIKDTLNDSQPIPVTIEKILNEVARTYNVLPADIRGKKRNANVSAARQMTMYIIREVTGMSMEAIGQEFQRDHSTVVYSIKTMEENISRDQHLKEMCSDIMKNVRT